MVGATSSESFVSFVSFVNNLDSVVTVVMQASMWTDLSDTSIEFLPTKT